MKIKKISSLIFLTAIFSSSVIMTSCSCKVTDEQLAQIAELRRQQKTISAKVTSTQNEKAKMNRELQNRQAEADDCNKRKDIVKQRLNQWPNIWPDYTPQP